MALQQAVGTSIAEEILFGAERRIEKASKDGELKGELRGELRGELKGERKLLKRLLGQRFGMLPPDVTARIDAASIEDLDAMGSRVLSATTLDEAMGTPAQKRC